MRKETRLVLVGLAIVLVGGIAAWLVQTDAGRVSVRDLRFSGPGGSVMSGLLYVPKTATSKTPAPAILAVHGYINSRETQSGFAIEYARRGYVVLALDETGHGYSDPPAFAAGFGGPAGLLYLRSLDIVDKANIGLEGHSMGGWAWLAAAAVMPDAYKAAVLEGSSTGAPYAKEGDTAWPRNLAVVFSTMDEFSPLMWGVPRGVDAPNSPKLQKVFGSNGPIEPGKIYGSIADGTARVLYQPKTTHPGDHLSNAAIGYSIDWFAKTLQGGRSVSNQIWFWKELATLVCFVGFVMFILGLGGSILGSKSFSPLVRTLPAPKPLKGAAWWIGAVFTMALPVILYYPFFRIGALVKASRLFPQTITSQIMIWALLSGAISLALFLLWHFIFNRKQGAVASSYGLLSEGTTDTPVVRDFLLAATVIAGGCILLSGADYFFKIDFRFWVFALKSPSPLQLGIAGRYLIPFIAFFLVQGIVVNGEMRLPSAAPVTRYLANVMLLAGGFLVFLLIEYIPLFAGGTLLTASEPLNTIVAIQFLPLMAVIAIITTWYFERTGRIYTGAFINAFLVTWYITAGQATQFPL